MNLFKKEQEDVKVIHPPVLGWLEKKLSKNEMEYLWRCIENRKESYKSNLSGEIHESNVLIDKSNWFFSNTIRPLLNRYATEFINLGNNAPVNQIHPYHLKDFWVNYQKQNEFNPLHSHVGVYSFVIWMRVPTRHDEQNKNSVKRNAHPAISSFHFQYADINGKSHSYWYNMNPEMEGTMLLFPSNLKHQVYPFYNCDEDRISISGNITLNTTKLL